MTYVLGIDSSTQSCKALLVEAETGRVVDEGRATHPEGTQVDPAAWIAALERATRGLIDKADAIAIAGQQHGMVALDATGIPVRDAMLWNDVSAAKETEALVAEFGGPEACALQVGSVLTVSFTGAKLRWLRDHEPENARRVASVLLPHDFLTWHLGGRKEMTTDNGDASGTGYYRPKNHQFDESLAANFLGHKVHLPRIARPAEVIGRTATGAKIAPGTGDNMAAALALGLQPGDMCISIGTSGVASTVSEQSVHDPSGHVAGFSDATGRYLPLACTLNGARVLDFAARTLGVDHEGLADLALAGEPGAHGATLLPYFDGERTPSRPGATGVFSGLTTATSRQDIARAAIEGVLCSMRDAAEAVEKATGVTSNRVILIGGAARSKAVRQIAPEIFGVDIVVPEPAEYVALGAARQAAWALAGTEIPPVWPVAEGEVYRGRPNQEVYERYTRLRDLTAHF